MHPVAGVQDVFVVVPTAEEAHFDVGAAYAEGFLAVHGIPQRGTRVLFGPYAGESAGVLEANVESAKRQHARHAPINRAVDLRVATEEIVVAVRAAGIVRVGAAGHAELIWVVTAHVLHGEAVFQRLAAIAALNLVNAANIRREAQKTGR